jgi:hypothetical protein
MTTFLVTIHASWKHGFTGYDESRENGTYLVEADDAKEAKVKAEKWAKENITMHIKEAYTVKYAAIVQETIK